MTVAPFVPDDSYISFRYAENLSQGRGLVFNPGERPVEGYSNFLWILLCAAAGPRELAVWAPRLGLLFGVLTLILLWQMLRHRRCPAHHLALVLLALATSGPFVLYAVSGLETPLCCCLLLAAVGCAERVPGGGRGWLLALAVAGVLFALARPEGVVLFPLLVALLWLVARDRLRPRLPELGAACGIFVLALACYHAWRVSYFGDLFPTPFHSKGTGGSLLRTWVTNLRFMFWRQNHDFAPFGYYHLGLLVAAAVGLRRALRTRRELPIELVPAGVAVVYGAIYWNFVDWMPGMRYWVPLVALWLAALAPIGVGLRRPRALVFAHALVLAIGLSSVAVLGRDGRRNEASTRQCLIELGSWLEASVPSQTLLAMSDVGATPYYSRLRTIDINPRSLTDREIAHHGWSDRYFYAQQPDVVVLVSFSDRDPAFYPVHQRLFDGKRFHRQYRLIGITRYDPSAHRSYWVFAAEGIRLSPEQIASFPPGLGS